MSTTDEEIQAVWNHATRVDKANPAKWRKDACGAWICRDHFGNHHSKFGWDFCTESTNSEAQKVDMDCLRPFQWKNAASRNQGKPSCQVVAYGGDNFEFH